MKLKLILAAGMLGVSCLAANAQDKMDLTPGVVEQLDVVSKLTNYGMERSDPLLLIAAARMLATLSPEAAVSSPALSAEDLLAKAKEMGDENVNAVADSVQSEAARGLCYGSGTVYGCF